MIRIEAYRKQGDREEILLSSYSAAPEQALRSLVVYELKYGGVVSRSGETFLETKTRFLANLDRTVFCGPGEEMRVLHAAAALFLSERGKVDADALADRLVRETNGNALLITLAAPLCAGEEAFEGMRERLEAAAAALGLSKEPGGGP